MVSTAARRSSGVLESQKAFSSDGSDSAPTENACRSNRGASSGVI